ncbi:MAG: tetratricopeptide repeat protein [Candidatus Hydrogenedentes bacterium]|nr:tetratricopeptide repeat protein [Candidatus Hydrogenedentota bacterium]
MQGLQGRQRHRRRNGGHPIRDSRRSRSFLKPLPSLLSLLSLLSLPSLPSLPSLRSPRLPVRRFALCAIPLLAGCYEAGVDRAYNPTNAAQHHYQRAESALGQGNLEEAIRQASAAAEADPEFDDAALLQATLLGRAGQYGEALAICTALTARSPDLVQAHLLEGILWDQSGDREAANRCYDETLRLYERMRNQVALDSRAMLLEGLAFYLRHGELEGVKAMNRFLARFPDHPAALYLKACMQNKDRGFLLRWFTERGGETPPDGGPEEDRNNTPGE